MKSDVCQILSCHGSYGVNTDFSGMEDEIYEHQQINFLDLIWTLHLWARTK